MAGNITKRTAGLKSLGYKFGPPFAWAAILFLFVFTVGCLEETDECIQHFNMDSHGNVYYTFEGENCAGAVYPPNQTPVMVQFDESYIANIGTLKDKK